MNALRFGRYRGIPLELVPRAYCVWLVRQPGVTPDARLALKRRLGLLTAAPIPPPTFDFKAAQAGDR
jgi:hypothetical protein